MIKIQFIFLFFLIATSAIGTAQFSDLAKVDYTIIPGSNSNIEYNRSRILFNYPIKLKKAGTYLFLGLDYSNINLIMNENVSFIKDELDRFQLLDFNIGYTTSLKNDWRLGVRITPGLSSNLTASDISIDDIVFSSDVVLIKDKTKDINVEKPWRLIFGISFSGNRGFPFPLPFISYYKKFSPKWSYSLGVPKTNFQYYISNRHRLKLYAELDGFTSNLQDGVLIDNNSTAESINMSLILGGLQYEFYIIDHLQFYARTSYILSNSVQLRDANKDNIRELDNTNKAYLRTGLRLKI